MKFTFWGARFCCISLNNVGLCSGKQLRHIDQFDFFLGLPLSFAQVGPGIVFSPGLF